ncbi:sarcosine oxidase subunit gamma family protein [Rhizobium leguminosarum]|uniref:sarcosine oxidase subunit gamma n=1 Tax=Rhizobium leguminosarum TaxID=384 RepID=UPI001A91EC95|nr:sarcosine oxidase subunit gamma [Rhizobium leguminosarum]MBY5555398.1 sarcosine oxidase subunit gamma family protein [Rhizobium leguminosarum]MBY5636912.1 sarcosine oxidase subunit gamma family protein [Rhizobium leguminosarum]MBY5658445.1 sarcosine oxidase subunit gamma family protein [Rhizobium leguminosarum]MBY5691142.1 sarcosine oxidase subunit gamma family protein [Rhizobium leguminosarum]MBY5725460.1 sarcosine oxidase subunit gamma family protein [Rhizobium leguminosarum]
MADVAIRKPALAGRFGGSAAVRLTTAPTASRVALRAPAESLAALSSALGLALPDAPKTSGRAGARSALWIGPDEWLVIDEAGADLMATLSGAGTLHSATDVSHRNVAIIVSGPGAEATLSAGCPQDLSRSSFPIGAASRTIFGKAEIVLFRTEEDTFRVECWRSFSDYVFGLLNEAAEDAGH